MAKSRCAKHNLNVYPCECEGICFHWHWFVCLSVITITKKDCGQIRTKFYGKVPREREDRVHVSLRSVEGCEVTVKKLHKPAIVYNIAPS